MRIRDLIDFEAFFRFLRRNLHKVAPGAVPEPGTAAEWTAGGVLGHPPKTYP